MKTDFKNNLKKCLKDIEDDIGKISSSDEDESDDDDDGKYKRIVRVFALL